MKKTSMKIFFLALAMVALSVTGCKKDNTGEGNEEEVITTVQLTFTPQGGGTNQVYKYEDLDGPGGINPTIDQIVLAPGKTYGVSVQLLNKTVTPVQDITDEISAEAEAHRFYFQPSAGSNITVGGLNTDALSSPLGTFSVWTTGTAATGTITITLRHYPGNPPEKAPADPLNSPKSSTDVEVQFPTRVQ